MRDKMKYYELYDNNGNIVIAGTSKDICKSLGVKHCYLYNRFFFNKGKTEISAKGGLEVVEVGIYRKVYDAYRGLEFLCTGTIEEVVEKLGISESYAKNSASPNMHKELANRKKDSKALLLFEHDEMIIEYH